MEDPAAKIFVGGLNHLTSANSLKVYFSRYGEVVATNIVFDRMTQKSRGFGFVQFTTVDTVRQVMPMEHTIDGKRVELKPAQKGVGSSGNKNNYNRKVAHSVPEYNPVFQKKVEEERSKNARKVFVGGLKLSTTTEGIIAYFERFGAVDECTITKNRQTGRSRGFGFVTFALQDTIDEVLKHRHAIEGKSVEIKRAENRGGKVPIIPDKKQDRNKGGSGPGGPRGSQGGFGGSGYGLIYGAFDFHVKMQQMQQQQQQMQQAAASINNNNSNVQNNASIDNNNNNNNNGRKRGRSRSTSNANDQERNVRQRRG